MSNREIKTSEAQTLAPGLLDRVLIDILNYLIQRIVDDEKSLVALSQTSRALRALALPRLRSNTVILDVSKCLAGTLDRAYQTILDFLTERDSRKPGYIRVLEIRDQKTRPRANPKASSGPLVKEFVHVLYAFLAKCINLRKFLRAGHEFPTLRMVDLVQRVLALPKLKILCLRVYEDWECGFYETPRFEAYERAAIIEDADEHKGIACLSIGLPTTLDRPYWDETWQLCRDILVSNIRTLKHLEADGEDMGKIVSHMPASSLAEMRLESLRFHHHSNLFGFRMVLGLTELQSERRPFDTSEDAVSSLRYLEIRDQQHSTTVPKSTPPHALKYMYTPNLKQLRVGDDYSSGHLASFSGLQCLDLCAYTVPRDRLQNIMLLTASNHSASLRTLKIRDIFVDSLLLQAELAQKAFGSIRRLEVDMDFMFSYPRLLIRVDGLWTMVSSLQKIREIKFTLPHHTHTWERFVPQHTPSPRESIAAVYSTLFFLKNLRAGADASCYPISDTDKVLSPTVLTPLRRMLQQIRPGEEYYGDEVRNYISQMHPDSPPRSWPRLETNQLRKAIVSAEDTRMFLEMLTLFPDSVQLFEMDFVEEHATKCEILIKHRYVWRKVSGHWIYEAGYIPLLR
ncbi:hypothetical protein TWF696_001436 [Orbilia brochopaga]|uniref:F-box domain-containing protein n=1 Tax=Orbilia brochopaga TaxID=3140254 RepID=A0AAV9U9G3_9PEZI